MPDKSLVFRPFNSALVRDAISGVVGVLAPVFSGAAQAFSRTAPCHHSMLPPVAISSTDIMVMVIKEVESIVHSLFRHTDDEELCV